MAGPHIGRFWKDLCGEEEEEEEEEREFADKQGVLMLVSETTDQ